MKIGDYAQLSAMGAKTSQLWVSSIQEFLANNKRLKIRHINNDNYGRIAYKFEGCGSQFCDEYVEPFKLNYDGPCPFKVGDSVRLRNEPDYVPAGFSGKKQSEFIALAGVGLAPMIVTKVTVDTIGSAELEAHNFCPAWKRFEYADDSAFGAPSSGSSINDSVAQLAPRRGQVISDHLFDAGRGDGLCSHGGGKDYCGARREQHEMLGTGLITKTFKKPLRAISRHETRLWDPYGEIDLFCRDSE